MRLKIIRKEKPTNVPAKLASIAIAIVATTTRISPVLFVFELIPPGVKAGRS